MDYLTSHLQNCTYTKINYMFKKIHIERPEFNVAEEALFKKLH